MQTFQPRRTQRQVMGNSEPATASLRPVTGGRNFKTKNPESPVRPVRSRKTAAEVATSLPFRVTPFGISGNEVAELVAAAILVATSGHPQRVGQIGFET